jgi:ribose 5-phosphate isomerase A
MGKMKAGPVVSDNGNFIIDAPFSREEMQRPQEVRWTTTCVEREKKGS